MIECFLVDVGDAVVVFRSGEGKDRNVAVEARDRRRLGSVP